MGICTNATCIEQYHLEALEKLDGIHLNVSLDGFSEKSHGAFRGNKKSFVRTIETIKVLAKKRLLKGLLVTPNNLAESDEYTKLCNFAVENEAGYVLMNPLSPMGRGVKSIHRLAASSETMQRIKKETSQFSDKINLVHIRFPNNERLPLNSCEAGNIIYIFTPGEVTVCPYLVFAANTPQSIYSPEEFIVGNIFEHKNIAERLDTYKLREKFSLGGNSACGNCCLKSNCGKGCPAAIIASGKKIEDVDEEICPIVNQ